MMDTSGTRWLIVLQAALLLVFRECPAVSPCCYAPCWPASCFMGSPQTPLIRSWTWVNQNLIIIKTHTHTQIQCFKGFRETELTCPWFSGHFEFTWQQFMIGVQSSLIMFPINILIVSIFRNTRPQEVPCCRNKMKKTKSLQHESTLQTVSSQMTTNTNGNVNLDIVIKVGVLCFCAFKKILIFNKYKPIN